MTEKATSFINHNKSPPTTVYHIWSKKSIYGRYSFAKKHTLYIELFRGGIVDTRKAIANRLLELCEEKRLSVNALARISAVPPSTLKNIINGGSKNAGVVTLKKLCDGLEISLCDFFNTETFRTLEQEIK